MTTEQINVVGEILIGLATVAGGLFLIGTHSGEPGIVGPVTGLVVMVLTFWYQQRGISKATNGLGQQLVANQAAMLARMEQIAAGQVPTVTRLEGVKPDAH